jgi:hypothetical protein
MKNLCKSFFLLIFLLLSVSPLQALTADETEILRQTASRDEGTANERRTIGLIKDIAGRLGLSVRQSYFTNLDHFYSYSSNLEILIPGVTEDEIVYAVPLNNPNSSLLPALKLLERFAGGERPAIGARFVFLGAEKGDNASFYPIGSHNFLRSYAPLNNSVIFYFDLLTASYTFALADRGNQITPLWILQQAHNLLRGSGFKVILPTNKLPAIRSRLLREEHAINTYLLNSYSAVLLSTGRTPVAASEELPPEEPWAEALAKSFYDYHRQLTALNSTQDIHYFIIDFGFFSFFISETVFIFIYLFTVFIILLVISAGQLRVQSQIRTFFRYSWEFILLYLIVFIFLFLAGLFIENLLLLKDNFDFWQYQPILFAFCKLTFAVFFISMHFRVIKSIGMANYPRLYASAAIIFCVLNLVLFTLWDITFAAPWLWLLFCTIVFTRIRQVTAAGFLIIVASVPLALYTFHFFAMPFYDIIDIFLFSHIFGNILISLTIFPVLLMGLSLYHSRRQKRKLYFYSSFTSLYLFPVSALAAFLLIFLYQPYGAESREKQPITVMLDEEAGIGRATARFLSPAPIGTAVFTIYNNTFPFQDIGRSVLVNLPVTTQFELTATSQPLLNRTQTNINLRVSSNPVRLELLLIADQPLGVIDCNYPLSIDNPVEYPNHAVIYVGKNPPNPLYLRIISERNINFQLRVTAFFEQAPINTDSSRFVITSTHQASQTLPVTL